MIVLSEDEVKELCGHHGADAILDQLDQHTARRVRERCECAAVRRTEERVMVRLQALAETEMEVANSKSIPRTVLRWLQMVERRARILSG